MACSKSITLVRDVDNGEGCVYVVAGVYGNSTFRLSLL